MLVNEILATIKSVLGIIDVLKKYWNFFRSFFCLLSSLQTVACQC